MSSRRYRSRYHDTFTDPGETAAGYVAREREALDLEESQAEIDETLHQIAEERKTRKQAARQESDLRKNASYLEGEIKRTDSELKDLPAQRSKLEGELSGIESVWQTDEKTAKGRKWFGLGGPTDRALEAEGRLASHKSKWAEKKSELDSLDTTAEAKRQDRESLDKQAKPYRDRVDALDRRDFAMRHTALTGEPIGSPSAPASQPAGPTPAPGNIPPVAPASWAKTLATTTVQGLPTTSPTFGPIVPAQGSTGSTVSPSSSIGSPPAEPRQRLPKAFEKKAWDESDKVAWRELAPEEKRRFVEAGTQDALQTEILGKRKALIDAGKSVEAFDAAQSAMSKERAAIISAAQGQKPLDFWQALGGELTQRARAAVVAPYAGIQDVALGVVDTLSHVEAAATGKEVSQTSLAQFVTGAKAQTAEWMGEKADAVVTQVLRGAGSSLAFVGAGANPAGIATLGATSAFGNGYREAVEMGAKGGEAYSRAAVAAGLGTTEAIPIARMFDRLERATGGAVGRFVLNSAAQSFEEGAQEAGQSAAQDAYDKLTGLTDKQWSAIFKDAGKAGSIAAFSGLLFGQFANYADRVTARSQARALDADIQTLLEHSRQINPTEAYSEAANALNQAAIARYSGDLGKDMAGFDVAAGTFPVAPTDDVAVLIAKRDTLAGVDRAGLAKSRIDAIDSAQAQLDALIAERIITPEQVAIAAELTTGQQGSLARAETVIQQAEAELASEQAETTVNAADWRQRARTRQTLRAALSDKINAGRGEATAEEGAAIARAIPIAREVSRYPDAPADPNSNGKTNGSSQRQIAMAIAKLSSGQALAEAEKNTLGSDGRPIFRTDKKTGQVVMDNPNTIAALQKDSPLLAQAYLDYEKRSVSQQNVQPAGAEAPASSKGKKAPAQSPTDERGTVQRDRGTTEQPSGITYRIPVAPRGQERNPRVVEFSARDDAEAREMLADGRAFAASSLGGTDTFDPGRLERVAATPVQAPADSFAPKKAPTKQAAVGAGLPEQYRKILEPLAPFFRQIQVTDQPLGSGGFVYADGNLILSLPDAASQIGSSAAARRKAVEELIHAITVQAEEAGQINAAAIFDALPEKLKIDLRKAYPDAAKGKNANWQMGHEFLRMVIQRKVSFGEDGKITWSDAGGQLLSEQTNPTLLARLREALGSVLRYMANLSAQLKRDGASDTTIAAIEEAQRIVRRALTTIPQQQGALEASGSHKPGEAGSNPAPATNQETGADPLRIGSVHKHRQTTTLAQVFDRTPDGKVRFRTSGGGRGELTAEKFAEIFRPAMEPEPVHTPETLEGEKINREWTAFAEDSGSLGIPRAEMPQIHAEHRGALVQFLKARGITHTQEEVLPGTLKPTQAEYSRAKVDKARKFEGGDRAILVSQEGNVVDGHHQWMAKLTDAPDEPMRVIRLNAPISELLPQIAEFPSVETSGGSPTPAAASPSDNGVSPSKKEESPSVAPEVDEGDLARGLSDKEWDAANQPVEELADFIAGQHLDQSSNAQRMTDRQLSRLFDFFEKTGRADKAAVVSRELERRSYEEDADANSDAANEGLYELMEAVRLLGGLPLTDQVLQGEIDTIREARAAGEIGLFNRKASPLDELRSNLADYGFDFATPADLLAAVETRLTTGKPTFGTANALFSQMDKLFAPDASVSERIKAAGLIILRSQAATAVPAAIPDRSLNPDQQRLVSENLGLANWAANRYGNLQKLGIADDDLVQEARIGLAEAARFYQPSRGEFGRFAARVMMNRLNKKYRRLQRTADQEGESLNAPIETEDENLTRLDTIAAPAGEDGESDGLAILRELLAIMPDRERRILLGAAENKDLRTIGAEVNLSHEGARKAGNRASQWLKDRLMERGITSARDIFPGSRVLASQSSEDYEPERVDPAEVGRHWLGVAKHEKAFSLGPTPESKDMQEILNTLAGPLAKEIRIVPIRDGSGNIYQYVFRDNTGGFITFDMSAGLPHVNSYYAKRHGTPIYQAIYAYAHNNGLTVYEDPGGLSYPAELRRTSQMFSSALRHGTTRHLRPAVPQDLPSWQNRDTPEATAHNIGLLAMKEAELVLDRLPELRGYNYIDGNYYDDRGTRLPSNNVKLRNAALNRRIAQIDRQFDERTGARTLARALATRRSEGSGGGLRNPLLQSDRPRPAGTKARKGDGLLPEVVSGRPEGLPRGLERVLYSQQNDGNSGTLPLAPRERVAETGERSDVEPSRDSDAAARYAAQAGRSRLWDHPEAAAVAGKFEQVSYLPAIRWGVRALADAFTDRAQLGRPWAERMPLPKYRNDFAKNDGQYRRAQQIALRIYQQTVEQVDAAYADHPGQAARMLSRTPHVRALFNLPHGGNLIDDLGEIRLEPGEPLFSQATTLDYAALDALGTKALQEASGNRSVGDWRLAFSADNEIWLAMDDWRKSQFVAQREAEWQRAAELMIRENPALVEETLIEKGLGGEMLNPIETKAAQILIGRMSIEPRSEANRRKLQTLIFAYRQTGTQAGRAMVARRDPHRSPSQRWREFFSKKIYTPPAHIQRQIDGAPSHRALSRRIAALDQQVERAKGQLDAAEVRRLETEIAAARETPTKEALLDADYNERIRPLREKLAKMGVSIDDILGGQVELRLMGAQIIKDVASDLDAQKREVISYIQRTKGSVSPEKISQRFSMPLREIREIYGDYREKLKAELTRRFQSGISLEELETAGAERALLSQATERAPRSADEAAAMAEKALNMMAFFEYSKLGRIKVRKATIPRTPEGGAPWNRPTGPGATLPDQRLDLRQVWEGKPQGDEKYAPPGDRSRLFTEQPATMPAGEGRTTETGRLDLGERPFEMTGEGRTTETGRLDLGEQPFEMKGEGKTGERSLFEEDERPWDGDVAYKFDPEDEVSMLHLARTIETLQGGSWVDYATEFAIANLLSAPITAITNLTGYGYGAYEMSFKRAIQTALNRGKVPNAAQVGEFRHMLRAVAPGLARAAVNASRAWATESPMFARDVLNTQVEMELHTQDERTVRAYIPGKFGRVVRIPFRVLLAADEFMKTVMGQMNAAAYAYRLAKARGITGANIERFVAAQLAQKASASWEWAAQEADRLSYQQPLRDWRTMQATGEGNIIEAGLKWLQDTKNSDTEHMNIAQQLGVLALRAFFPFIRTPYRLVEAGWQNTLPGSILDNLLSARDRKLRDPRTGQVIATVKADEAKKNALRATLINAALWTAALSAVAEGDDDDEDKPILITGTRPREVKDNTAGVRQLAYRTVPPMSVKIGDFVWSYQRIDPFSTMIATTVDAIRELKDTTRGKPGREAAAGMVASLYSQLLEKASLRGFSDLNDLLAGNTSLPEYAVTQTAAWTVPNLIRNPVRNSDPVFRDTRSEPLTAEAIAYQFLPAASLAPPAKVDAYGREQERPGNWLIRTFIPGTPGTAQEPHEIDRFAAAYNRAHPSTKWAPATPPNRITKGGQEREMTAEEYNRFLTVRGRLFTALARETGVLGRQAPTDADKEKVTQAGTKATREAKRILFGAE